MAFAIPRFNAQPGQSGPLAPRMDPGEAAAGGLMLARAGRQAMDASVEIQRQAQGMRRMEALAGASQELADLAGEVDKATDPDAIRPMIQQRADAIRQRWMAGLSGDAEGQASVGLRLTESVAGLTRAGDRRTLALRTDAFNARVLDAQRELTTRAANGDAEAVRTFGALLEEGVRSGFYGPTDAAKQQQAFQAEVQGAQVLRMVRDNPGAVAGVLADPARFTALRADQRERFVTAAATRQQAMAAQSIAADSRAEAARRRQAEAQATAAEKDIIDATRAGNVSAAQDALARLRTSGSGDSYRTYEGIVNGTIQDIPTTPVMRAMVSDRLADPGNPLTRQELNTWLADGRVSQTLVAETLPRIRERENADFREAEAFVGRALNVPSGTIADRDLQPWQRQARLLSGQIINDLMVERQRNPGLDPLKYVRDRLANDPTPQQNLAAQRNAEAFRRLPAQARTRDGLDQLQAQVDAWVSYQRLPWLERQQATTPPRPPTINGQAVTQDVLTRWRGILDAAGVE